jgi:inner membrane protein
MDLLTQGVLGAALAQSACTKQTSGHSHVRFAAICGFFAGLAADADALLRSATDPLAFLEYHRHFTHALAFIPAGGLICAAIVYGVMRKRSGLSFGRTYLYCTLGYATHGLLDACTTYGTSLLWPFSDARIAWNIVAIVDPLVTLPMIALLIASLVRRSPVFARAAMLWLFAYLGLGAWQHNEAVTMAANLAAARGHDPMRIEAKPSFGNILVWKTIYDTADTYYVDAVRTGPAPTVFAGASVKKLDLPRDFPWLVAYSQQATDIERFRFFSDGFIAKDPAHENRIIDIRYSFVPNDINALWSIELSPDAAADAHARYLTHRDNARASAGVLWRMIVGG